MSNNSSVSVLPVRRAFVPVISRVLLVCMIITLWSFAANAQVVRLPATAGAGQSVELSGLNSSEQSDLLSRLSDEQVRHALIELLQARSIAQLEGAVSLDVAAINRNIALLQQGLQMGYRTVPRLPELLVLYREALIPPNQDYDLTQLILGCVAIFLLGWLMEYLYLKKIAAFADQINSRKTHSFSLKVGYLGQNLFLRLLGVIVFTVVSLLAYLVIAPPHEPLRIALLAYMGSIILIRTVVVCSRFLFAPYTPELRIFSISGSQSRLIHRLNIAIACYVGVFLTSEYVMKQIQLDQSLIAAWGALFGQSLILFLIISSWIVRAPIRTILQGNSTVNGFSGILVNYWYWFESLAFFTVSVIATYALIVEQRNPVIPALTSDLIIMSIPILVAMMRGFLQEFLSLPVSKNTPHSADTKNTSSDESLIVSDQDATQAHSERTTKSMQLISRMITFLLIAGALVVIISIWGYRVDELIKVTFLGQVLSHLFDMVVVVSVSYTVWVVASYFMDPHMPTKGTSGPGDEGGGVGSSRISTLMPILKKILLTALVIITVMVYLSGLGVDIGPLLAGAGIVGIALGFGAQALVKDVISGMFYLVDDAFRKGEYIEIGDIRGTVESISIRSFQLRHHNGPIHTIPYGEISSLTNYSRDWVIMKFEIRIPFETDVEMVRKLIKKIGVAMMEEEEFKTMLIDPLKSQGVNRMDDSALIVRCKFTAHPGHQFYLRRVAYAKIQEAFKKNAISFAAKRVIVETHDSKIAAGAVGAIDGLASPEVLTDKA